MQASRKVEVQIVNAFVHKGEGGNPAGIVLDADHYSKAEKLAIAAKVGLSETAFVSQSDTADFKLDFFTPNRQIAHCGHATIATFSYLKQQGILKNMNSSKETIDGNRKIRMAGDLAFMEQRKPTYTAVADRQAQILESLGIQEVDLLPNAAIQLVNTGNSFVIVPVRDVNVLKNMRPHQDRIAKISEALDLIGYYVFAIDPNDAQIDAKTRMFAPRYGIEEEAATGMAGGPLATYLYDILHIKKPEFKIEQGRYMKYPSPSLISVNLQIENGKITGLMAGGKGILKSRMVIDL